jgi:hypothetical protein
MRKPGIGETNLGALAAAPVGGIFGLFALGIAPAIITRNPAHLVGTPILGVVSMVVCAVVSWLIGGQIGPRVGWRFRSERAELVGGLLSGLVAPLIMGLLGWYSSMG